MVTSTIITILIPIVVIVVMVLMIALVAVPDSYDEQREELTYEFKRLGLEVVDLQIQWNGSKSKRHYTFQVEVRRPGEPGTYSGHGKLARSLINPVIHWNSVDPTTIRALSAEAKASKPSSLDLEQQINMEVAARLDRISGTPGAMLEHDLDGSGHIDSAEWDALRAKVRAEVELERGLTAAPPRPPPSDEDEPEPEGTTW